MSYPADAPALQPDVVYRVSVTASGRSSDDAAEPSSGFSVMGGEAAEQARAGLARIGQLGLAPDAARLLSAHFLAARGLSAEAVEQLDAAAPTARPLLLLGALYQAVGLTRLAEEHHRRAAAAAAKSGDIEAQAQAQLALGTLYMEAFGLREDAARAFGDAAALFDRLGDQASTRRATEKASHAKSS